MIGQILNERYKIIEELGRGGCGITYLAKDQYKPSKPNCVVKQLQSLKPINPNIFNLFEREAQTLERLGERHNQLPSLFAYFQKNEQFYIVMEFIDGHELNDEIYANEQWSETGVIGLLQEILEILEFVHQNNVIHRDIKPSNIMRRKKDGKLVLIDFGIVKEVVAVDEQTKQTRATAVGTKGYRSPEQWNGISRPYNDVYAVGMLGIEALTREMPDSLPKDQKTAAVIWRDRVSVSDSFAKVLEKMVCYEFQNRYQNAQEALTALRSLQTPLPPDGDNSTELQLSNTATHNRKIEKYLNDFIKKYDQIDDFMQLRDQSVEDDKQSLSALYIEPKLSKEQTFNKIYERVRSENQQTRLIITGSPGFGKSTLLQMIGVRFAREEASKQNFQKWRIPVFIKLADYAYKYAEQEDADSYVNSQPYNLHNYISEVLTKNFFFPRSPQEIEENLREGKYLLLLDALDEIGNDQTRKRVWDSIDSVTNYSNGNSLITCRSAIAKQYQLQRYSYTNELLELEENQIIEYVRARKPLLGEEKTNKLEEQIKSNSKTKTILSNPLLLYMTVGYLKNALELPSNLNVKLFADHLIKERPKRRGSNLIPENQRYKYCQYIAQHLHERKIKTELKEVIIDVIKKLSRQLDLNEKEANSYLNFLVEDIGLIEISDERCEFIHFTFQEFFVASYYGDQESNKLELINAAIANPSWWFQVIVRYYNLSQDYELLEQLIDEDRSTFAIGTMMAVDCLIEVVTDEEISEHNHFLYNKLFERLREIYCNSPYELQRDQAWRRLKALGGATVFSFIDNELDPGRSDRRQKSALAALGEIATNQSVKLLGEMIDIYLEDEKKPELFFAAIGALIATRNNEAKEKIKNIFGDLIEEEENDLIKELVKQLACSNLLDYINILLEQLEQPELPIWLQVIILRELGNPPDYSNVFPEVINMFWHRLQLANANALQVEILLDAIKFAAPEDMRNYAKSMLRQDNTAIVASAVRFFRYQQDTSVLEDIIDLICNSQERKLQEEILTTLVRIGREYLNKQEKEKLDIEFLCDYVKEESINLSPLLREQVIVTLKELDSENCFDDLSSKLKSSQVDPEIQVTIIKSIYNISQIQNIELKGKRDLGQTVLNYLENNRIEDDTLLNSIVFLIFKIRNQSQVKRLLEFATPANNSWWGRLVTKKPKANSQRLNKEIKWLLGKALIDYLLENDCHRRFKSDVNKWIDNCISQDATDDELASEAFKLKLHLSGEKLDILRDALEDRPYICLAALENHHEFPPDELLRRLRALLNNYNKYNDEVVNYAIELLGKCGQQHERTLSETEGILFRLIEDDRYKQKAFESLSKLKGLLDSD
ncbi:protein kinase domain-containing protein [Coleofasciculus sp. E1-EBD-02]|uniref:protein kinase domain-containing protein n=1 Tax=Coleofasciculus sp. E1-EBD-02 TaxID=3068481 RepID=UPI0032F3A73E